MIATKTFYFLGHTANNTTLLQYYIHGKIHSASAPSHRLSQL